MKNSKILAVAAAIGALALQQASAQVTAVDLGTGNPPATLGAYTMSPFDPGSIGGATQGTVGVTWATWGQGYLGHVYESPLFAGVQSVTLTLSGGAEAVDFYEEPNQFSDFDMTATDSSGASVTTLINGRAGSAGVGFYENVAGGPYLTSITVTATDPEGFAIGEFGISGGTLTGQIGAPDTGWTLAYLALGAAGLLIARRRLVTL